MPDIRLNIRDRIRWQLELKPAPKRDVLQFMDYMLPHIKPIKRLEKAERKTRGAWARANTERKMHEIMGASPEEFREKACFINYQIKPLFASEVERGAVIASVERYVAQGNNKISNPHSFIETVLEERTWKTLERPRGHVAVGNVFIENEGGLLACREIAEQVSIKVEEVKLAVENDKHKAGGKAKLPIALVGLATLLCAFLTVFGVPLAGLFGVGIGIMAGVWLAMGIASFAVDKAFSNRERALAVWEKAVSRVGMPPEREETGRWLLPGQEN